VPARRLPTRSAAAYGRQFLDSSAGPATTAQLFLQRLQVGHHLACDAGREERNFGGLSLGLGRHENRRYGLGPDGDLYTVATRARCFTHRYVAAVQGLWFRP